MLLGDVLGDVRVLFEQIRGELEELVSWLLDDETVASDRLEPFRTEAHAQRPATPAASS